MKDFLSIGICYYLPQDNYINIEGCIPLQLGYNETHIDMGISKDSDGDNRSLLHPIYSEYSGIYWIWKNTHSEYKGIFHHRRALTLDTLGFKTILDGYYRWFKCFFSNINNYTFDTFQPRVTCATEAEYLNKVSRFVSAVKELTDCGYTMFLTVPVKYYNTNIRNVFSEVISKPIFNAILSVLKSSYSSYYPFFIRTWESQRLHFANISIMRADLYDDYCSFVFGVIDGVEKELLESGYYLEPLKEKSLYRTFGYIGELLTNSFALKKIEEGFKIKRCNLLFCSDLMGHESTDYTKFECK